jgi:D-alanyl-D-alanine carboxypeptidase/D-alanyl-D-alanine-endopeptidase (penicillin-binding protein 4)
VLDVATGASLYARSPTKAAVPASATKILTAAAALVSLGPHTTLPTRAVVGTRPGEVVLVGGGDVMLAPGAGHPDAVQGRAGLGDLADVTAAALRANGTTAVTVRVDDTLFTGPAVNPAWSRGDVGGGFVAPVMSVAVTVGVTRPGVPPRPGLPAARVPDPALSAGRQFATQLAARGIAVSGPVARAAAPDGAAVLGEVRSASVGDIVEHDLTDSDNTTAEVLARLVAIASGKPATFAGGGAAVVARIAELGVPVAGARLAGGSGLGTRTVAPAGTVVRTLALAADPGHPQLRALLSGLPVAGASGTLADRFTGAKLARGAGVVRAKTGTLTGVGALAGTLVDADGRLLAFAVLADAVPATDPARSALDAVAATLAGCGCR